MIPTLIARDGDDLLIHGATPAARSARSRAGQEACLEVTHVDGIVLARSAFHHSMNYRSAILYGTLAAGAGQGTRARVVHREARSRAAGSTSAGPTRKELKGTEVLSLPAHRGQSAKVRSGPPGDDEPDYALDTWAGVVPITTTRGEPIPDPLLKAGIADP